MTPQDIKAHFQKHDSFARGLDIDLTEINRERGVAVMPLDERHLNGMGQAHGGAIFSLVDMAFAAASNADGIFCVNAQTSISYLNPGKASPLTGVARAVKLGRKMLTYEVAVTDAEGTLVATAVVTGYKMSAALPA